MLQLFHVSVKAVIYHNEKVLLLKEKDIRNPAAEKYDLPGGRVDAGELFENTLKRELNEELGIKEFIVKELISLYQHPTYHVESMHLILLHFRVEIPDTKIKLSDEHTSYHWMSAEDFENRDTSIKINHGMKLAIAKIFNT